MMGIYDVGECIVSLFVLRWGGGGGPGGARPCVLFGWPGGGGGRVWDFGFGHCPNVSWDPNSSVTQEYHDYK